MTDSDTRVLTDNRAAGHEQHTVVRAGHDAVCHQEIDQIAIELPVALEYNGINHAVMLATPADLVDLAWGFSMTEGIIRRPQDIYDVGTTQRDDGVIVHIEIASACVRQMKQRRRQLAGRTGCGLCGLENLSEVRRDLAPLAAPRSPMSSQALLAAANALFESQTLHRITGATHAAAWADHSGRLHAVREDVGRHNALDKLIGHLLRQDIDAHEGMALVSSRASFEMVQKTAAAGIPVLAAISAPTSYAIRVATELNLTLAGFVRDRRFTVYSHPQQLIQAQNHHA